VAGSLPTWSHKYRANRPPRRDPSDGEHACQGPGQPSPRGANKSLTDRPGAVGGGLSSPGSLNECEGASVRVRPGPSGLSGSHLPLTLPSRPSRVGHGRTVDLSEHPCRGKARSFQPTSTGFAALFRRSSCRRTGWTYGAEVPGRTDPCPVELSSRILGQHAKRLRACRPPVSELRHHLDPTGTERD